MALRSLDVPVPPVGTLEPRRAFVGASPAMRELHELISDVAATPTTVLIRGESGTGKELVARQLHARSDRAAKPFVAVNCATLLDQLAESELFGHVRGAFTGAVAARKGCFELADGGTLFLDEIGDISPHIQAKLLRVLQEGEIQRLGDDHTRKVRTRVIAATHVDLERAIERGTFREDLYYRLNVFQVRVPALRERRGDIPLLAEHFVETYGKQYGRGAVYLSTPALEAITRHSWPGNVRELENCISRAVLLAKEGVIRQHHLPPALACEPSASPSAASASRGSLEEQVREFERALILKAMRDSNGNQAQAARVLQTTPRILGYALRRHGLYDQFSRTPRSAAE